MTEHRTLFREVRPESLSGQIAKQIAAVVGEGIIAPGERLPSERELTEQFGVSRVVVREALRSLETGGLIEVRPGRGAFVRLAPGEALTRSWQGWLATHRDEVLELLEIRRAIEQLAARGAAERATDAHLRALAAVCDDFEREAAREPPDVERLVELDVEFHHRVAVASGGSILPQLVDQLASIIRDSRRAVFAVPGRATASAGDHRAVLEAIASTDPDAAAAALAAHLATVVDTVRLAAAPQIAQNPGPVRRAQR